MNFYDSELAEGILSAAGYDLLRTDIAHHDALEACDKDGPFAKEADVVIMNTCSVREHAEDRVYGRLGMLGKIKRKRPDLIVGLMGCMVEEHREKLFNRFPQLDFMVGTRNVKEIPALIEQVLKSREQVARIKQDGISIEYSDRIRAGSLYHSWLPIMTGCDKVCTFCIVPLTRGAEVSMPVKEVCAEAERLAEAGVKWITLLGQNVNSYRGDCTFPELLDRLSLVEGIEKISFTTSHPEDATEELFQAIARNPKISRRFHLPLQSGSDQMLKRMKRMHTYAEFKEKIERLRELVPDVVLTTDIIAGFSGETEEDHQATVNALNEIRFDWAYIYKYSVRPGTPASKLPDDVPITLKERRNQELIDLERKISKEINETYVGQTFEVFVEDISRKNVTRLAGRSHSEKKVVFSGEKALLGTFQSVRFDALIHETFVGSLSDPAK